MPSNNSRTVQRMIKDAVKTGLRKFGGYEIVKPQLNAERRHVHFRSLIDLVADRAIYSDREWAFLSYCAANLDKTRAQCFQDLFVLFELEQKSDGFFVEFGAASGVAISNSYLLEKEYNWKGILSEPAHCWREGLEKCRTAKLDFRCVWSESGRELQFHEHPIGELSTLASFNSDEKSYNIKDSGTEYTVSTVSLNDLLEENSAPCQIDYLSIDTEGSELEILSNFNFSRHDIKIITVEHNYVIENRQAIYDLLARHGYNRVFEHFSAWDDWYVRRCQK